MRVPIPATLVAHGALDHAELRRLGIRPEALIDFSSNINPFGPPPGVRAALAAFDPSPYPDRSCLQLRMTLAARDGCAPEAILAGNGANELIHLLARALLQPDDTALIVGPTYGEYAHASQLAGAQVVTMQAQPSAGFRLDHQATDDGLTRLRPRITWLCTPNNPSGVAAAPELLGALAARSAAHGGYLILDQSYAELQRPDGQRRSDPPLPPNVISLRSLTKSYALAGLRLGYLRAAPALVARVGAYQPAWSVSSAAQAAGLAALADDAFLAATVPQLWAASDALEAGLRGLGLTVWRAALPVLLVRTGDGAATRAALLARGYLVRDCASFGLPAWVRVSPQRPAANTALLEAWNEIL